MHAKYTVNSLKNIASIIVGVPGFWVRDCPACPFMTAVSPSGRLNHEQKAVNFEVDTSRETFNDTQKFREFFFFLTKLVYNK